MSALSILDLEPAVTVELWRPVPDWPYEASDLGRIRRIPWLDADGCLHLGGIVAQCPDKRPGKGYLYVTMRDGQRRRKAAVAVLVLEAWRGLRPAGCEACHNKGIRTDNRLSELRWDTKAANRADRAIHELERAETTLVTTGSETDLSRYRSQVRRGDAPSGAVVTAARYGDGAHGTGSFPIPFNFPSQSSSVNPFLRTFRTPFQSLRNRKAA